MKLSAIDIQIVDEFEPFFDGFGDMPGMRTVISVSFRGAIYDVAYVHSADGYDEEYDNACYELDGGYLTGALIEAEEGLSPQDAEEIINCACASVIEADGGVVLGYSA